MLQLLAFSPDNMDVNTLDASTVSPGVATALGAGFGIAMLFMLVIYLAIIIIMVWSWGNLLQAALKISKWNALLLLIPLVNFIMIIVWGAQASKINKGTAGQGPSQQMQGNVPPPAQ